MQRYPYTSDELRDPYRLLSRVSAGHRPQVGTAFPRPFARLVQQCWDADPSARPPFDEISLRLRKLLHQETQDGHDETHDASLHHATMRYGVSFAIPRDCSAHSPPTPSPFLQTNRAAAHAPPAEPSRPLTQFRPQPRSM